MRAADGAEFRRLLNEAVAHRLRGNAPVALLFSGGTDSLTVLWSLLDLGAEVRCYCFRLGHVESVDSRVARVAVRAWTVPLEMVIVPWQETADLARDVKALVGRTRDPMKTRVECAWPFTWVAPRVRERTVFCGLNADDLWGSSKGDAIRHAKDPKGFRTVRAARTRDPRASAWAHVEAEFARRGMELFSPYRDGLVAEHMLRFSWRELNRPRQKMLAVLGFGREFRRAPVYRRNDNLQCGSGIREYFARMLADPAVNVRGRKGAARFYRDLMEGTA